MDKLLVATSNPGKLTEIKRFLNELPIEIISLSEAGIKADAPETGNNFTENAVLKAKYYFAKSGMPTLADDGGFEIDALNGEPGVKSHRWVFGDRESTDEELISYTIERMKGLPSARRGAQLHLVLALITSSGEIKTAEALVRGIIPEKPSQLRTPGFPYRSLLFIPEIGKFYDHSVMTEAETEKYNHRRKAIKALIPDIKKAFGVL
jgi:XTP/dITP diphosphohydrolase